MQTTLDHKVVSAVFVDSDGQNWFNIRSGSSTIYSYCYTRHDDGAHRGPKLCRLCVKKTFNDAGGTSNIRKHLAKKHPEVWAQRKAVREFFQRNKHLWSAPNPQFRPSKNLYLFRLIMTRTPQNTSAFSTSSSDFTSLRSLPSIPCSPPPLRSCWWNWTRSFFLQVARGLWITFLMCIIV